VFLDVQMPEVDGFDVLEQLGALMPPALVFVTAYDQYALRAFEAGALDYLLKPFDNARFDLTLERACSTRVFPRPNPWKILAAVARFRRGRRSNVTYFQGSTG
jgi:DNA-binding LytR/AlgR family response regulator